jgi:hypothetical protein
MHLKAVDVGQLGEGSLSYFAKAHSDGAVLKLLFPTKKQKRKTNLHCPCSWLIKPRIQKLVL